MTLLGMGCTASRTLVAEVQNQTNGEVRNFTARVAQDIPPVESQDPELEILEEKEGVNNIQKAANGLSFEINFDEDDSSNGGGVIQKPPPRRLQKLVEAEERANAPVTLEKLQEKLETAEHRRQEILLQRMRSATLLTVPRRTNGIQSSNFSSLEDENLVTIP